MRISKIVIPIALAISLVFAGFSVFADKAENFVVRTDGDRDVKLSLTFNRDLTEQTTTLYAPASGNFMNMGFIPDSNYLYQPGKLMNNIPDDIAKYDGMHSGYDGWGQFYFYSFSFFLVNNSARAVDVDMIMNIDGVIANKDNDAGYHVDDAIKIMLIEDEPLLSDGTYTVYSKAESSQERKDLLYERIEYEDKIVHFYDNSCIFKRTGDNGFRSMGSGEVKKFTLVLWLEGEDMDCSDPILGEQMKMSIDFIGY